MNEAPLITLTTDFGAADGYVGAMKGVVLDIAPHARLVDISHEVVPQNVRQAAYVLYTACPFFPSHAVHLVVVDPGVGGARRPIALRTSRATFVGPDNGVFSYVTAEDTTEVAVELADPRYRLPEVSHTFHGRDVFAPAAAYLAAGVRIEELGPMVPDPAALPLPRLEVACGRIAGEVLHADHFGNVITSIGRLAWDGDELSLEPAFRPEVEDRDRVRFQADEASVAVADLSISPIHHTYAEVEPGDVLALVGSGGHLEVAAREGSAASKLGLRPGDPVALSWR